MKSSAGSAVGALGDANGIAGAVSGSADAGLAGSSATASAAVGSGATTDVVGTAESAARSAAVSAAERSATVAALEALGALVDGVVAFDRLIGWASAGRAELIEAAVQWSEVTRLSPEVLPAGPRWDPGVVAFRTVVSELAVALRLPDRTAESLVGQSRALVRELPRTRDALREGRISYRHAQGMIDHAMSVPADARAGFEDAVLPDAEALTVAKFERKARRVRERTHPASIRERHLASVADRCVQTSPDRDGMAWLGARLPAPEVMGIHARITDLALGLRGPDESRTLAQLRADVFTDLLLDGMTTDCNPPATAQSTVSSSGGVDGDLANGDQGTSDLTNDDRADSDPASGFLPGSGPDVAADRPRARRVRQGVGRGVRARVFVTVPVLTLLGHSDEPGELEGYGPIDADTARRLAAGAPGFTRLLTHPETGVVLSMGRDRYKVPRELRTWLRIRDETCRFPGCGRSAARSDIDHSLDWQLLGVTAHDNLAYLCRSHHSLKHQTGWSIRHAGGGVLDWTSPTRREYSTEPATAIRTPGKHKPDPGATTKTTTETPPPPPPGSVSDEPPPF